MRTHKTTKAAALFVAAAMALTLGGCAPETTQSVSASAAQTESSAATLVLRGGTIHTMDPDRTVAQALAVQGDTLVYVGGDEGVEAFIGENTRVIELDGRTVLPGFIDSHIHPASGWVSDLYQCNLFDVEATEEAYVQAVAKFAEENPDLKAIVGLGFQANAFGDLGPTRESLDAVVSDRPVILTDTSGHSYWTNSKAIEMAGITEETAPTEGGKIYYNEDGTVRGYFSDVFLFNDVFALGKLTGEQYRTAWMEWQKEANSYGITAVSGMDPYSAAEPDTAERLQLIHEFAQNEELTLRTSTAYPFPAVDGEDEAAMKERLDGVIAAIDAAQASQSDFEIVNSVKIYIDGVVEGRTAVLLEPYAPEAGLPDDFKGEPMWQQEQLDYIIQTVDKAGYSIHIHSIADGGTRMCMDAIEKALEENGTEDHRHTMTHLTLVDPQEIDRMAQTGVIAAMQPIWFYRDPWFSQLEEQMLGSERFARMYAIRDMVDAGVVMTGSADYCVLPDFNPLSGIEAGATQCSPYPGEETDSAYLRNPEQTVEVMDMLEAYTINGAYQMRMEDKIGSLEVGKLADLAILDSDPLAVELQQIGEITVECTIVGGKVVYER